MNSSKLFCPSLG